VKLASLNEGRDGHLVVVSHDLTHCISATPIAATMQAALDDWKNCLPQLEQLSISLAGKGINDAQPFDWRQAAAPLPRAYQWLDGSVYLNHAQLLRRLRNAELPADAKTIPLMYQGGSDRFAGPTADILANTEEWGIDFEAEIAIITDDVPMGVGPDAAAPHIKLAMLANDVSFRSIISEELKRGLGLIQGKPATAFAPVAVTLDELGEAWSGRKLHIEVASRVNGQLIGAPNSGRDMYFDFAELISHACKTRELGAGTVIGAGTISNHDWSDWSVGSACIAERRMIETLEGRELTNYLHFGDRISITGHGPLGASIFGAIEQVVVRSPIRDYAIL
jgi:fumarylacetoacetate (FAA) hydrolase